MSQNSSLGLISRAHRHTPWVVGRFSTNTANIPVSRKPAQNAAEGRQRRNVCHALSTSLPPAADGHSRLPKRTSARPKYTITPYPNSTALFIAVRSKTRARFNRYFTIDLLLFHWTCRQRSGAVIHWGELPHRLGLTTSKTTTSSTRRSSRKPHEERGAQPARAFHWPPTFCQRPGPPEGSSKCSAST